MKTAVDWLENQIKTSKHYYSLMKEINSRGTIAQSDIFELAKSMEKEQIEDAHNNGYGSGYMDEGLSPEQYYNETFKKD